MLCAFNCIDTVCPGDVKVNSSFLFLEICIATFGVRSSTGQVITFKSRQRFYPYHTQSTVYQLASKPSTWVQLYKFGQGIFSAHYLSRIYSNSAQHKTTSLIGKQTESESWLLYCSRLVDSVRSASAFHLSFVEGGRTMCWVTSNLFKFLQLSRGAGLIEIIALAGVHITPVCTQWVTDCTVTPCMGVRGRSAVDSYRRGKLSLGPGIVSSFIRCNLRKTVSCMRNHISA